MQSPRPEPPADPGPGHGIVSEARTLQIVPKRPVARVWWVAGPLLAVLIAAISYTAAIPLDYLTLSPGSARSANAQVRVPRSLAHRAKGNILFTTVSVRQPSGIEALLGVFDDDVEVDPRKVITGGQSQDRNEKFNLQEMQDSKEVATKVALEKLGYKVGQKAVGAVITDIDPKLPSFDSLTPGDTVIQADGKPVRTSDALVAILRTHVPGDKVAMKVRPLDNSGIRSVRVATVKRPGDPKRAFLGVSLQTRPQFQFPVKVTVSSGDVGGPSAGLAFTLAIIDQLTPGNLTGGKVVAVTGTIQADGSVGEVGGVHQKTLAAIHEGATLMIVPTGEYHDAVTASRGRIRVEKADTVDEALRVLDKIGGNAGSIGTPGASASGH